MFERWNKQIVKTHYTCRHVSSSSLSLFRKTISQLINQSFDHLCFQSINHNLLSSWSVSQSVGQSLPSSSSFWAISQSINKLPVNQQINMINQAITQSFPLIDRSISQSNYQSIIIGRSGNQQIVWLINRSFSLTAIQPVNQSIS